MKDPIIKHIEENRRKFDTDAPDDMVWENINKELHPKKKRRPFVIFLKIAAVFIGLFGGIWFFKNTKIEPATENLAFQEKIIIKENGTNTDSSAFIPAKSPVSYNGGKLVLENKTSINNNIKASESLNKSNFELAATSGSGASADMYTFSSSVTSSDNYQQNYNIGYRYVPADFGRGTGATIDYNYEQYDSFEENKFENPMDEAISTFGIDVDGAGYSNMRRYVNDGYLPPKDAVKLEEMINYFNYNLAEPRGVVPFSITTELGSCPWNSRNKLLQIAIKGKSVAKKNLPANNLVFLLDVSGSMNDTDKLPLLKKGFKMLVNEMRKEDRISIVVYAGASGVVLPPTSGDKKETIMNALDNLSAGGGTAGGEGLMLAYGLAEKNFSKEGNNRIILATDGDFNVGLSGDDALVALIEEKRKKGISISVLGFGTGNLQSSKMEKIADNGNGNFSYIDNVLEAKKVLVTEMGGTLLTIAKDVKLQLEFNPATVSSYRLLGYENRKLATKDFDDDTKDAGDLGSGHTIVALYEIVPNDGSIDSGNKMKYQTNKITNADRYENDLVTIKFRYKDPKESKSKLITKVVYNRELSTPSENFNFASSVAEFGLLIRDSKYKADADFDKLIERARNNKGKDYYGYRAEFIRIAEKSQLMKTEFEDLIKN